MTTKSHALTAAQLNYLSAANLDVLDVTALTNTQVLGLSATQGIVPGNVEKEGAALLALSL